MSVHVDYDPSEQGVGGPRRRGRWGLYVAAAVGVVVLVVSVVTTRSGGGHEDDTGASRSPTSASGSGDLTRGQASSTGASATRLVSGKPRGFPHSSTGAVEAATTYMASTYDLKRMPKPQRAVYVADVTDQSADTGESAATAFRSQYHLNDEGQLVGPATGVPVTNSRFTSSCYPALGAYRVTAAAADQVSVQVWMPCVVGSIPVTSDAVPDLDVLWTQGEAQMSWRATRRAPSGDWLATRGTPTTLITPTNKNRVALPYAERERLLGHGWTLYADATEAMPPDLARLGELQ